MVPLPKLTQDTKQRYTSDVIVTHVCQRVAGTKLLPQNELHPEQSSPLLFFVPNDEYMYIDMCTVLYVMSYHAMCRMS